MSAAKPCIHSHKTPSIKTSTEVIFDLTFFTIRNTEFPFLCTLKVVWRKQSGVYQVKKLILALFPQSGPKCEVRVYSASLEHKPRHPLVLYEFTLSSVDTLRHAPFPVQMGLHLIQPSASGLSREAH